jgi:hypothetical protein
MSEGKKMKKIDPEVIKRNLARNYEKTTASLDDEEGKFVPVKKNRPPRKKKGSVNKPTRVARESLAFALQGCTDEIKSALMEVRHKNPKDYIECVVKLLPYVTPKLLAAQVTEDKSAKIEINLTKDTSLDTLKNLLGEEDDSVEDVDFEDL